MRSAGPDREAVHAIEGLSPPSIKDGKIQTSVQHHFLAAGPGSLQWPAGIVEPDIDALHKVASDVDVIVLHKHELVVELGISHQFGNLLQDSLAGLVQRMSLAGEYELHRSIRIVHHRSQPLDIGQNQVRSFVSREPAGKSNG